MCPPNRERSSRWPLHRPRHHPDRTRHDRQPLELPPLRRHHRRHCRFADWYFSNGKDYDGVTDQLDDLRTIARAHKREVKFGLNGFIIAQDTEKEAQDTLREIVEKANRPAVDGFRAAVKQAGASTSDGKGMWADSSFEDLVQYNDGFKTKLIGTPEQVAERIVKYRRLGVDLILAGFLHFQEEVEHFGKKVLPIVRELEAEQSTDLVGAGASS
jgi:FMNH2-dependent dimethyl sulfone monooxygenase